ncbi:hydrolase, partial [Auriculariales sp. MPI-PUGE-AT-0066]
MLLARRIVCRDPISRHCSRAFCTTMFPTPAPTGKAKKKAAKLVPESVLSLPAHSAALTAPRIPTPIVDTHTHLSSIFSWYKSKYKDGAQQETVWDFVRAMCLTPAEDADATKNRAKRHNVRAMVDVWCEPASWNDWREFADSAVEGSEKKAAWGSCEYWFAMGVHPHEAKHFTDDVEAVLLEAMKHPRCVSFGEIGLDYHYSFSEHPVQQEVFRRQLSHAVKLQKPITIHTREAEDDTEKIMKELIPRDHRVHVHCFTDSPEFAERLLDHWPNLFIGITGVVTYTTNLNTPEILRRLANRVKDGTDKTLRILLETDGPYMTPSNIYESLPELKKENGGNAQRLPLCHSGMVPWTAEFVSEVVQGIDRPDGQSWMTESILDVSAKNAAVMYGV